MADGWRRMISTIPYSESFRIRAAKQIQVAIVIELQRSRLCLADDDGGVATS